MLKGGLPEARLQVLGVVGGADREARVARDEESGDGPRVLAERAVPRPQEQQPEAHPHRHVLSVMRLLRRQKPGVDMRSGHRTLAAPSLPNRRLAD